MSATPARRAALKIVSAVRSRDAFAHEVLTSVFSREALTPEDTAFATRLAYGVIQSRGTLDEILDRSLSKPTDVTPDVRDALQLAVYEIVFLGKPGHAAVHQGVELVRSVAGRAAGLANAVLRKVVLDTETFPWGDPQTDVAALARLTAHPLWMAERLVADLGFEAAASMMEADSRPAPLFVAANPFLASDQQVFDALVVDGAKPVKTGVAGCIMVEEGPAAVGGRTLRLGLAVVADASAQLVASLSAPAAGSTFLEIGSGRGTKTILLQGFAERSGGTAAVHALDSHQFKVDILQRRMKESGVPGIVAHVGDARDLDSIPGLPGEFDGALIDAPCSGLGTLRRHPEKRWRLEPADLTSMAQLSGEILASVAHRIKVGGYVVFSTCTVAREEDEDVVEKFLASEAGSRFVLKPFDSALPEPFGAGMIVDGYFRSVPAIGGPDGHFAAKLVRVS